MDHKYENLLKERDHYQREYAFIVDKLVTIPLRSHNNSRESPLTNLTNLILERDEFHRLGENLQHQALSESKSDSVHCELKRRLSDQGREISDLKQKYRLLQDECSRQAVFTSSGQGAFTSSGQGPFTSIGQAVFTSSGQGPFTSSAQGAFTSSGQGPFTSSGQGPFTSSGQGAFTSSGQGPFTSEARDKADLSARRRGPSPTSTGVDLDTYLNLQDERDKLYLANCKLQEEKTELLSRIKKIQMESSSMNEDRIRGLESERRHLITKQSDLTTQLGEMEEENRGLKKKLYACEHELCGERNSRNSIRRVQEQTDHALHSFRHSQETLEAQVRDLKEANTRLEAARQALDCQVHSVREDNTRLRACLQSLDTKNDSILRSLDSKIDLITRLERDMTGKDAKIEQLEDRIAKLKSTLETFPIKLHKSLSRLPCCYQRNPSPPTKDVSYYGGAKFCETPPASSLPKPPAMWSYPDIFERKNGRMKLTYKNDAAHWCDEKSLKMLLLRR